MLSLPLAAVLVCCAGAMHDSGVWVWRAEVPGTGPAQGMGCGLSPGTGEIALHSKIMQSYKATSVGGTRQQYDTAAIWILQLPQACCPT